MGPIYINGDGTIKQPSGLKEEIIRHVYDKTSITGRTRRTWLADKRQVVMTITGVNLQQYAQIAQYIYNQANPVTYYNSVTGINFTGFVTAGIDEFLPGNQWMKNLTITILEL